jgi:hypothetical protein
MYGGKGNFQKALMGTQGRLKKVDTLSHGQSKLLDFLSKNRLPNLPSAKNNPMFQTGQGYLQNLLGQQPQERYQGLEAPYMRQFQQEIMPGIAEQYAGAGALNSSGFQNAAASAGQSLMERLASLNLNQQNIFRNQQLSAIPQAQSYSQQPFNEQITRRNIQQNRFNTAMATPAFGYQNIAGQPGIGQGLAQNMIYSGLGGGGMSGMGGVGNMFGSSGGFGIPGLSNMFGGGQQGGGLFGDTSKGGIGGMTAGGTAGSIGGGLVGTAFGGPIGGMIGSTLGRTIFG